MTSTAPTTHRRFRLSTGLVATVFMLLTTLTFAPAAEAQPPIDVTPRFDVVTNDCAGVYLPSLDELGSAICYDTNPHGDGVYGDQGAFACSSTAYGRKVYPDVDPTYSVDHFPYIEVLYGCYYYPGVTFVPNHNPQIRWTPPTNVFTPSWTYGF